MTINTGKQKEYQAKYTELHHLVIKHNFASYDAFAMPLKRRKEKTAIDTDENLLVVCSICGKSYNPTVEKVRERINSRFKGDGAFCCPECKKATTNKKD